MGRFHFWSLWLVTALLEGVHSVHWSSTSPTDVVYACTGESVTLAWEYIPNDGDVIGNLNWYFDNGSPQMVAARSRGNFLLMPYFRSTVEELGNAGISINRVLVRDSGNYSVTVEGYDADGVHFLLQRSVYLQIGDNLLTQDGLLKVTQNPEVVLNPDSNQWAIQLKCGAFIFHGEPPYQVQWTTPSGTTRQSSDFSNGHFNLLLNNPIEGGDYVCEILTDVAPEACLRTGIKQSYRVDTVGSRLALLEKENEQLHLGLTSAGSDQTHLQQTDHTILLMVQEINSTLLQLNRIQDDVQNLNVNQSYLQTRLQKMENAKRLQIGFHAQSLESPNPPYNTPLLVNKVLYNHGNAYGADTGYFTAPVPGVYFFIGTTGSDGFNHGVVFCLTVDSTQIGCGYGFRDNDGNRDQPSVHGLVHLTAGQKVWLSSSGNNYATVETSFTGALLLPDLA